MKKIYLAALTLAMTACVSNDDLNPVDNYGYIDLNVSTTLSNILINAKNIYPTIIYYPNTSHRYLQQLQTLCLFEAS